MRQFTKVKIFSILLIFLNLLTDLNTKPLIKEVLQNLESDKQTFLVYKDEYKKLACKLLTYSRMKNLYDEEVIDVYLNQTDDKIGYLNLLQSNIQEKCIKTLSNNMVSIYSIYIYLGNF
jgi:hypothetical protein